MADKNFVVKNGLVVNTAFNANSTNVSFTVANLTINTTAFSFGPGIPLNVNGGAITANNLSLVGDGTNAKVKTTTTSGHLTLGSNNTDQIIIAGNGNIGIANLVPTTKLAVLGTTYLGGGDLVLGVGTELAKIKANNTFGTDKQVLMSNSTGGSYWGVSTAVAGSDSQVQFNDGGSLGASDGLTFGKTANTLTVGNNIVTVGNVTVGSGLTVSTNAATIGTASYFVANGNFGINTPTPDRKLVVNPWAQIEGAVPTLTLKDTDNGTDAKNWDLIADATTHSFRAVNDAYTVSNTWLQVTRNVGAITNISFPTTANVGIGVTNPLSALHIKAATNPIIRLEGAADTATIDFTGALLNINANNQYIKFTTGTYERMSISAGGDISIGTVRDQPNGSRILRIQNLDTGTSVAVTGASMQLFTKSLDNSSSTMSDITKFFNGPNAGALIIRNGDVSTSALDASKQLVAGTTATIKMIVGNITGLTLDNAGNLTVPTGSVYSKKYYDYDDVTYFLDPASDSRLSVAQATGRFWTGYDPGAAAVGSVGASNWFRSNLATGWINESYNGGIYMTDATAVRVFTASGTKKKFIVENGTEATYFSATSTGGTQDLTYNGTLISSKAASTGQHINLIRTACTSPASAAAAWSIGYDYNTPNFAIGYGRATDADFTGANVVFSITPTGSINLGSSISLGNSTCNTVANSSSLTVSNTLSVANLTPFSLNIGTGLTTSTVTAIIANSNSGIGINGVSNTNIGVFGKSTSLTGVSGGSVTGVGVQGVSNSSSAVAAYSNTGTGLYVQSNTGLVAQFSNATAEFMRISATGNVGIGTTGPGYKLDITGTGDIARLNSTSTSSGMLMTDTSGTIRVGTRSGAFIVDITNERMRVEASGNVGIACNSPSYILDAVGTGRVSKLLVGSITQTTDTSTIRTSGDIYMDAAVSSLTYNLYYDGTNWKYRNAGPGFAWRSDGSSLMQLFSAASGAAGAAATTITPLSITAAGNVGINVTGPQAPLQVGGALRAGAGPSDATNATITLYSDGTGASIEAFQGNAFTTKRNIWLNAYGGNVGVGKTNPGYKLDVATNINNNDGVWINNSNTSSSAQALLTVQTSGAAGFSHGQAYSTKNGFIYLADNAKLELSTNATVAMTIAANSNIGIGAGSGSPKAPLVITPSAYTTTGISPPNKIRFFDDGANNVYGIGMGPGYLDIHNAGGLRINTVNQTTNAVSTFATFGSNFMNLNGTDGSAVFTITPSASGAGALRMITDATGFLLDAIDKTLSSSYHKFIFNANAYSFKTSSGVSAGITTTEQMTINTTAVAVAANLVMYGSTNGIKFQDGTFQKSAAGAAGGGTDKIFWENDTTITTNYTITTGKNAGSFGPITINSGIIVTVPSGSVWSIV